MDLSSNPAPLPPAPVRTRAEWAAAIARDRELAARRHVLTDTEWLAATKRARDYDRDFAARRTEQAQRRMEARQREITRNDDHQQKEQRP